MIPIIMQGRKLNIPAPPNIIASMLKTATTGPLEDSSSSQESPEHMLSDILGESVDFC